MDVSSASPALRSGLITGLAWTFIVLAGFATLISLLQNILITLMFPAEEMRAAMREVQKSQPMPAFAEFVLENIRLFLGLFFVVCAVTLVSSIGLLMRKNWARLIFVGLMVLGVLWNLMGAALPFLMFSSFSMLEGAPGDFQESFKVMATIMAVFAFLVAMVFSALFLWIAKRLLSDDVRREFHAL
ncbi:MAG: hypothetical protein KIT13_02165 [Burkholderiales bacterium]|nr:hypothetical protein [Burkholderiales bacterium]